MPNTAELPVYAGEGAAQLRAVDGTRPRLRVEQSSLRTLTVDGRRIAYQDVGDVAAPAVILAHCSGGSHREWTSLLAQLASRYRVIVPDLIGYGASEPWQPNDPLPAQADADVLVALARLVDWPVHLVGHSYGGAVALDAARALGPRVRSLTLIEPASYHLLRPLGRMTEWDEINAAGEQMVRHMRKRRDRAAARAFYQYWLGALGWWLMPPRARQRCLSTIAKVAAEFETLQHRTNTASDYIDIHASTRLVVGSRTKQPARAVVEELLLILPNAGVRSVVGAGHMSPITHPSEVNALVAHHVNGVQDAIEQSQAVGSRHAGG